MYFTIEKLLQNEAVEGLRLIAGKEGIGNVIHNTNIMDNPDTFDWLMPGDLVLTTGFVFKDDVEFQVKVIKELAEINCAALAIKTRKYFGKMPQAMVEAANAVQLPLLEIPTQYSLAQFSNAINKEIFKAQDTIIEKSLTIHEKLTEITLSGGGIRDITKKVSQLVQNPVIVVDSSWNLVTYSDLPGNPFPLEEHLTLQRRMKVFPLDFFKGIPNDAAVFKKSIKRHFTASGYDVVCRIVAIKAASDIFGYIVVWESMSKLQKIDYVALEKAAIVAALDRIKVREVEEAKHQIRRDFFDDLLAGKIESLKSVNSLAEMHGMDTERKYLCMVLRILQKEEPSGDHLARKRKMDSLMERISLEAEEIAKQHRTNLVTIHRSNQAIFFLPVGETCPSKEAKVFAKEFARDMSDHLFKQLPELNAVIGIGKLHENILRLNLSFEEAQEAIRISGHVNLDRKVVHFDDFIIYNLLQAIPSKEELVRFYDDTLKDLVDYDRENNTNLVETLEHYFLHQGNVGEASRHLFIHRNTLIYRLDKIRNILGSDLRNAEEALELHIGLKIMKMLKMR